jgi:hypothetical protein
VRAVKFIFKQAYPSGSFDAPPPFGTVPGVGKGHAASRAFGADGSLLATSPSSSSWPAWLPRLEIGISGSANTAATNPQCARFTSSTEASSCNFGSGAVSCVAPLNYYRISEFDCVAGAATNGTGGSNDGVYLRATFNRAQMSSTDNLMVVVEYVAAAYNSGAKDPTLCMSSGVATPETCSDLTWKSYLKHSGGETTQPFFMLIPPTQSFVSTGTGSSGASPIARQIILPLANDQNLTVFQLSRIGTALTAIAAPFTGACPSNSALCAGVTLYSITFYRM